MDARDKFLRNDFIVWLHLGASIKQRGEQERRVLHTAHGATSTARVHA
jgi:hypothetical protein